MSVFQNILAVKTVNLAEKRTFALRWQNFCGIAVRIRMMFEV